jgi:hypothetical protein
MIELTKRALHRLKVVEAVTERRLTQEEAGRQMGLTMRQVKRLVAAYRARGAAGLVSRRVGQPPNRRLHEPLREAIRALLVARYPDFRPGPGRSATNCARFRFRARRYASFRSSWGCDDSSGAKPREPFSGASGGGALAS